MDSTVNYGISSTLKNDITPPTTLTTAETDIFIVKNGADNKYVQLTIYAAVTLGAVASADFYYYFSPDGGTTWHPVSLYNTSSGEITQRVVLVDSGTYATGGVSLYADNLVASAATAFKVTGKSATGTPAFTIKVMGRNN